MASSRLSAEPAAFLAKTKRNTSLVGRLTLPLQATRDDVDSLPMAKPKALIYLEKHFIRTALLWAWAKLKQSSPWGVIQVLLKAWRSFPRLVGPEKEYKLVPYVSVEWTTSLAWWKNSVNIG